MIFTSVKTKADYQHSSTIFVCVCFFFFWMRGVFVIVFVCFKNILFNILSDKLTFHRENLIKVFLLKKMATHFSLCRENLLKYLVKNNIFTVKDCHSHEFVWFSCHERHILFYKLCETGGKRIDIFSIIEWSYQQNHLYVQLCNIVFARKEQTSIKKTFSLSFQITATEKWRCLIDSRMNRYLHVTAESWESIIWLSKGNRKEWMLFVCHFQTILCFSYVSYLADNLIRIYWFLTIVANHRISTNQ